MFHKKYFIGQEPNLVQYNATIYMSEDENVKRGTSWISSVSSFIESSSDIQYYTTINDITDAHEYDIVSQCLINRLWAAYLIVTELV